MKYAFIRDNRTEFSVRAMCRIFKVHFSGFYSWMDKPLSNRAIEDQRLLKLIKEFYVASGATYGSPWIHRDMREAGDETIESNQIELMEHKDIETGTKSHRKSHRK